MDNKRNKIEYYWMMCLLLGLFISIFHVSEVRAEKNMPLGMVVGFDENNNAVAGATAVCVWSGDVAFVYSYPLSEDYPSVYFVTGGEIPYLLSYAGETGGLTEWYVSDEYLEELRYESSAYKAGWAQKGEDVVIYYDDDGELNTTSSLSVQLLELNEKKVYTLSDYPLNIKYPAVIVNNKEECVGFLFKDGLAGCSWADMDFFYETDSQGTSQYQEDNESYENHIGFMGYVDSAGNQSIGSLEPAVAVSLDEKLLVFTNECSGPWDDRVFFDESGKFYYKQLLAYPNAKLTPTTKDKFYTIPAEKLESFANSSEVWTIDSYDKTVYKDGKLIHVPGVSVKGDTCYIYYLVKGDADCNEGMIETTIEELDENGNLTLSTYPDEAVYPAVIANENGECVGVIPGEGVAVTFWGDVEAFYASEEKKEDIIVDPTKEVTPNPDSESNTNWGVVLAILLVLVAGFSGIVIWFVLERSKQNTTIKHRQMNRSGTKDTYQLKHAGHTTGIDDYESNPEIDEIGPTTGIDDYESNPEIDEIGPTTDVDALVSGDEMDGDKHPSMKIWLVGKEGYMKGRVYPISECSISIGTDPTCTVCYPLAYKDIEPFHVKITFEQEKWMLRDCGTASGTYEKNFGRLNVFDAIELKDGTVFSLGAYGNLFEIKIMN